MRASSTSDVFRPEGAGPWTIGRSVACAWVLSDPSVSRLHARLERAPGGWRLFDEESANGTRIDGSAIASVDLVDGLRLALGDVVVDCALTEVADSTDDEASAAARLDEVARLMRRLTLFDDEDAFLSDPELNLSAFVGVPVTCGAADAPLRAGDGLRLGGSAWRVLHTPGHSPGSTTLVCDDAGEAIVGDTLFAGSIGRVDFPTSDPARMRHSLREVLMALPDAVRVYPGHGPSTTIGAERRSNPFLQDGAWDF